MRNIRQKHNKLVELEKMLRNCEKNKDKTLENVEKAHTKKLDK